MFYFQIVQNYRELFKIDLTKNEVNSYYFKVLMSIT